MNTQPQNRGLRKLSSFLTSRRYTVIAWLFSLLIFTWFATYGSFRFFEEESFGSFYDEQAASLIRGRLDVLPESIGNEAFVFGGKTYGYFGLTPALLRLPFAAKGILKNRLSRLFMVLYFGAALVASAKLLRLAYEMVSGPNIGPPDWASACLILCVGPGSTFLMLGSRSFIYHEAILCGAAFALASASFSLRWLARPESANWAAAVGLGFLAVQGRPPSGLFALTLTGVVALTLIIKTTLSRGSTRPYRRPLLAIVISIPCVLSFNLLSYLKFSTWEACPLRYAAQYTPERLKMVGYASFHIENIPHNIDAYFTGIHVKPAGTFPFFEKKKPASYEAKTAFVEPGKPISIPLAMPALFLFSLAGTLAALLTARPLKKTIIIVWIAAMPMTLALCAAIAVSQRYTADFIPFLTITFALGLAVLDNIKVISSVLQPSLWAATLVSLKISFLITFNYQGTREWGIPPEVPARYSYVKSMVDGFLGTAP